MGIFLLEIKMIIFSMIIGTYNVKRVLQKYPLSKSSIRVVTARDFFPVLKTFVVPILPDPISLISFFKKIFVKTNPKGIDPNK